MLKDDKISANRSSIHLDLPLLDRLSIIQHICLALVVLIAGITLSAWMFPPVGRLLPAGWMHMKANTSVVSLCSVLCLVLSEHRRGQRMLVVGRALAGFVALMAVLSALQLHFHSSFGLNNLLVSKAWVPPQATGIGLQPAIFFALLCLAVVLMRVPRRFAAISADLLVYGIGFLILIIGAGYLFGANHFGTLFHDAHLSRQTLVCLLLLSYVIVLRKTESGFFAILSGAGIGSKIARIACPFALLLPFVLNAGEDAIIQRGWMKASFAMAMSSSVAAMMAFSLILVLAWRINALEKSVHDLSLRDELTQVYNRRGFYLLAEQSLYLAQRSSAPFSVLFIDLDDLKRINDSLGHDVGSSFLYEVARLLKKSFRKSDVIGRIGGDEFAVAGESSRAAIQHAVERMNHATEAWNAQPGRAYRLSFSYGVVTSDGGHQESLEDLLDKADQGMYAAKRHKKQMRGSDPNQRVAG
jgi:diguanylate cyclase (GGDEF)-like protein